MNWNFPLHGKYIPSFLSPNWSHHFLVKTHTNARSLAIFLPWKWKTIFRRTNHTKLKNRSTNAFGNTIKRMSRNTNEMVKHGSEHDQWKNFSVFNDCLKLVKNMKQQHQFSPR